MGFSSKLSLLWIVDNNDKMITDSNPIIIEEGL